MAMGKAVSEPLYKKVYNTVVQRIADAQYLPGSMLPSEFDLAAELNVSQGTARKALIALEQNRIVERRQGKGTFVTLRTPENSLFHFFRLRSADGSQVAPQLLSETVSARAARQIEKKALFGHPDRVYQISRIRSFNDKPLCHESIVVPTELFPGLMDRGQLTNALYVLYQQSYSCIIVSAEEHLAATTLEDPIATQLSQKVGAPAIVAHRKAFDLRERVVELRTSIFLTDKVSYFVDLN